MAAVLFMTFGNYLVESLDPIYCFEEDRKDDIAKLFGFGMISLLTLFNMFSLKKFAARLQVVSMVCKILAISAIILIGAYFLIVKGWTSHYAPDYIMKGSNYSASEIVLGIYQGSWAFAGYNTLNFGTEEIEKANLAKILTVASLGGLAIASTVYILAAFSYFVVLSPADIMGSDAVARTFIQKTLGTTTSYFVPGIVGILLIGTLNGDLFTWSRYMWAGSKKGLMPSMFKLVHPDNDSPRISVFTHSFLSLGFAFVGNTDQLVNYLQITSTLNTIFIICALIWIKWKQLPVSETAVKFSIIWPILNLIINIGLLVIPLRQDAIACGIGTGCFLVGVGVYFLMFYPERRFHFLDRIDNYSTVFCQIMSWTVLDNESNQAARSANEQIDRLQSISSQTPTTIDPDTPSTSSSSVESESSISRM
ncbi:hypothetical protein WR25_01267 isoform B [Diploscapter pachys]|uniref:Cationic amino acid transporter C-terminal domain-containing protein n=1 Tax=Diploscapter pachys TaxID=2018661 RepID=A0A2A2LY11_9BILA|nr:hypothetical protein WR25_01267 isoform A [Diploscapter pachys]PAV91060.1 hypothetical protein WR25_01267 isoform B [Diploscapter pachys]